METNSETIERYVIDIGCIRKNARGDLLSKARSHSRGCALMGHCVESGYRIVTEDDQLIVLDPEATLKVVREVEASDTENGIRLRVQRERSDKAMETTDVREVT